MTQQLTQKAVNTFVRGLVTEANELTFPENASVDELNCELERAGNRRRRLGFKIEDNDTPSTWTIRDNLLSSVNYWDNVGGAPGLTYIVFKGEPICISMSRVLSHCLVRRLKRASLVRRSIL